MKTNKLTAAAVAAVTAFAPLFSGGLTASAKTPRQRPVYPTWVPKDFESALEFSNTYGNTRVEGQFVCFVLRRGVDTSAAKGYLACFPPYTCSYDSKVMSRCTDEFYYAVDEPWENDRVFEVIVFCTSSVGTFHLTFESAEEGIKQYTFDVDDDFNVTETDKYSWLPDCEKEFDEFRRQNGEVSVRGNNVIFCLEDNMGEGARWVHHSTEWARYVEHIRDVDCSARSELIKNDAVTKTIELYKGVKDGNEKLTATYMDASSEDGEVYKTLTADCEVFDDAKSVLLAGQTRITVVDKDPGEPFSDEILANHPFTFGTDVRIGRMYTGPVFVVKRNPQYIDGELAELFYSADSFDFLCSDQPEITKHENGALDLLFRTDLNITGDVNKDGVFGIADAVCLQNWLLNGKTDEYFDWKAADLCIDNKLDIFDLVMLRKKLTKTGTAAQVSKGNEPVLVVETAASWKQQQDILVYDASGTAHHVYKSDGNAAYGDYDEPTVEENVPIIEFGSDGWYEELEDIISKPYSLYAKLKLDEEMLSQTIELSRRAEEISSENWLETQPHWLDGSTMTIYLVNKVDSGETHLAKLCTLLASDSCLDNAEVQDYVRELLKKGAVDYPYLDMELETYLKYAKNKSEAPEKVTNVTA